MIKIIKGNILNATEDIICQQVNCMGVMGAGLAKQIKNKYPEVYTEYRNYCNRYNIKTKLMGTTQHVLCKDGKIVSNLFGQLGYGRDKIYTHYPSLKNCFEQVKCDIETKDKTIAIPYNIGCGLAGGSWSVVYKIIEDVLNDCEVTIYKFD